MSKTIRILAPDWQGGNKPEYFIGAQLLSWLAPNNHQQKEIQLAIQAPNGKTLVKENGVTAQTATKENVLLAKKAIKEERPDKIITFGGTCLVSQAPFDYLHGKYGKELGIIWLDSHPDISTPENFYNEHAMVLGNLLGEGDPALAELVEHPLKTESILYVGLQQPNQPEINLLEKLKLDYTIQGSQHLQTADIQNWIAKNNFKKIAIHLDLDVLNPKLFRSLYFSEPGVTDFPSDAGKMSPANLLVLLKDIFQKNDVVGLTIAEYLPWDVVELQKIFSELPIFE